MSYSHHHNLQVYFRQLGPYHSIFIKFITQKNYKTRERINNKNKKEIKIKKNPKKLETRKHGQSDNTTDQQKYSTMIYSLQHN